MAPVSTTTKSRETQIMKTTKSSQCPRQATLAVDIPSSSINQSVPTDQKHTHPPSPHRTFSDPLPAASPIRQFSTILGSSDDSPKSAGHTPRSPRNIRFGMEEGMSLEKSTTTPAGGKKNMVKRRHSHDPRMNVYTGKMDFKSIALYLYENSELQIYVRHRSLGPSSLDPILPFQYLAA